MHEGAEILINHDCCHPQFDEFHFSKLIRRPDVAAPVYEGLVTSLDLNFLEAQVPPIGAAHVFEHVVWYWQLDESNMAPFEQADCHQLEVHWQQYRRRWLRILRPFSRLSVAFGHITVDFGRMRIRKPIRMFAIDVDANDDDYNAVVFKGNPSSGDQARGGHGGPFGRWRGPAVTHRA